MMKFKWLSTALTLTLFCCVGLQMSAQAVRDAEADTIIRSLKTIDPNIVQYFPRWQICEPNIQAQIEQTFLLYGRKKENLDMQRITITAGPKQVGEDYQILLVECGNETFVASEVDQYMKKLISTVGAEVRAYCYRDLPVATPPSEAQTEAIISFMQPTNVSHSIMLSAFEQSLKIGKSGFWIRSILGTDQIGYHFWSSGESHIILQRPLYDNDDPETALAIPYLINARIGGAYRLRGGLDNGALNFLPSRRLNSTNGKAVFGVDVHAPFHPQFGVSINAEVPLSNNFNNKGFETDVWALNREISNAQRIQLGTTSGVNTDYVLPVLGTTGQIGLFYNWWLDPKKPENFFRFDFGVNYTEVRELAVQATQDGSLVLRDNIRGLNFYGLREFSDWVYGRLEYRNQGPYPFGATVQYSNQMLFLKGYLPLLGQWLYLEAKYSTSLRSQARPWEIPNFFMVSPVLRLNIR